MPPQHERRPQSQAKKSLEQVIEEQGLYPVDAFDFVRRGLTHTVEQVHANLTDPEASHHVSGQQLCQGLRDFALSQWGLMARTVLLRWNIIRTEDFGKIVFTLIENGEMAKNDDDTLEDFRNVYDFATGFDAHYRIASRA